MIKPYNLILTFDLTYMKLGGLFLSGQIYDFKKWGIAFIGGVFGRFVVP